MGIPRIVELSKTPTIETPSVSGSSNWEGEHARKMEERKALVERLKIVQAEITQLELHMLFQQ